MRATFDIDELVLIGFDPRNRHEFADTLERELAAAWRARDALSTVERDVARLRASINIPPAGTFGAIAQGISGVIVRVLATGREEGR